MPSSCRQQLRMRLPTLTILSRYGLDGALL
ncbi:hypothetical protein PanWU01x14_267760 [Parasponia andersonii]|uniref:Uncharacterized protein n=1 Tax=Parasponia andersonii TaxID=3476 RepID=A0A2P5B6H5_PARAD|nr:hypothetical protein PanWU01x14_267760 [Parasponia andersonii]